MRDYLLAVVGLGLLIAFYLGVLALCQLLKGIPL